MKKSLFISLCLMAGLLVSCMKGEFAPSPESYTYPDGFQAGKTYTAIATLKRAPDGVVYLQVNENLKIVAEHPGLDPLWEQAGGPARVYCQFHLIEKHAVKYYWAEIEWYEFVAMWDGSFVLDGGDDGLDIVDDWMTSLEDGFLTIHYSAWWGRGNIKHFIFLERDGLYTFRLIHEANGDERIEKTDALYCLNLDYIADIFDEEHNTITIKWKTCAGQPAEKTFLFKGRED